MRAFEAGAERASPAKFSLYRAGIEVVSRRFFDSDAYP
jgi:hypothetical protein